MYNTCTTILRTLKHNPFVDDLLNQQNNNKISFVYSYYKSILHSHMSYINIYDYTYEEIAFGLLCEYIYSSRFMECDVLYRKLDQIVLPGAGVLRNEKWLSYYISYSYKRGNCDAIFDEYPSLLDRVYGVKIETEYICDIFDVGEHHYELYLFKALLALVQDILQ